MHALYVHKAGATAANVVNDLILLITGTTAKASLSADCVSLTITSTVAAGWTLHDASAGASIQCVKCLDQGGSLYKFAQLQFASTIACSMAISEDWDATAHTGTNQTTYAASVWAASVQNTFQVNATPKNITITPTTGGNLTVQASLGSWELSRDTIPSTYPCNALLVSGSFSVSAGGISMPRIKVANGAGDATNQTTLNGGGVMPLGGATSGKILSYRDASNTVKWALVKIGVTGSTAAQGFHAFGTVYDLLLTGGSVSAASFDEIAYNGKTYVVVVSGTSYALLLPKE